MALSTIHEVLTIPSNRGVKSKWLAKVRIKSFWLYGIHILIHRVCKWGGLEEESSLEYVCASRSKAQ